MDSRTKNDTLSERSSTGTSTLDSGCTTPRAAVPLTLTRKASLEDYNKIMAINIKKNMVGHGVMGRILVCYFLERGGLESTRLVDYFIILFYYFHFHFHFFLFIF